MLDFRHGVRGGNVGPDQWQHDHEFVSSEAGHDIGAADGFQKACADVKEQFVPYLMAERVVDVLEAIQVDEYHGETAGEALGQFQRLGKSHREAEAIGQVGDRIVMRQVFDFEGVLLPLRHALRALYQQGPLRFHAALFPYHVAEREGDVRSHLA